MSRKTMTRVGKVTVAVCASGLMLASCSSNGSDGGSGNSGSGQSTADGAVGIINEQPAPGEPVDGGSLSFASLSAVASLDPTKTQPTGATGGTEMAAVYDLLVRYDAATEKYEPQLAQSITESDDHLTWTLKLRDGVTFSDGTPLDADAVVASTIRFNEGRGANNEVFTAGVKSVEATDASTVVYTMNQPWPEFPALLTSGHGMVVAPTADGPDGAFTPIGAGAYTFTSLNPGAEMILTARPDYWNGKPHLDQLKFVMIASEQPKIDALKSGGLQMAFLRNAQTVDIAKADFTGYLETLNLTDVVQINNRDGHPGSDVRVRKAMALAINPEVINQRSKAGEGMPGTEMFQPWSKWHSDVSGITPNVDDAKKLLEEAKADGYDGNVTYFGVQTPDAQATALAIQSMLQAVGFTVNIEYGATISDVVKRLYVDHDFDVANAALNIPDAAPYLRLYSSLNSQSANNTVGVNSPEIDEILNEIQSATTDDSKRAAIAKLQTVINEQAPFLAVGAGQTFIPWTSDVHGVVPSLDSIMLLDQAWIQ